MCLTAWKCLSRCVLCWIGCIDSGRYRSVETPIELKWFGEQHEVQTSRSLQMKQSMCMLSPFGVDLSNVQIPIIMPYFWVDFLIHQFTYNSNLIVVHQSFTDKLIKFKKIFPSYRHYRQSPSRFNSISLTFSGPIVLVLRSSCRIDGVYVCACGEQEHHRKVPISKRLTSYATFVVHSQFALLAASISRENWCWRLCL